MDLNARWWRERIHDRATGSIVITYGRCQYLPTWIVLGTRYAARSAARRPCWRYQLRAAGRAYPRLDTAAAAPVDSLHRRTLAAYEERPYHAGQYRGGQTLAAMAGSLLYRHRAHRAARSVATCPQLGRRGHALYPVPAARRRTPRTRAAAQAAAACHRGQAASSRARADYGGYTRRAAGRACRHNAHSGSNALDARDAATRPGLHYRGYCGGLAPGAGSGDPAGTRLAR